MMVVAHIKIPANILLDVSFHRDIVVGMTVDGTHPHSHMTMDIKGGDVGMGGTQTGWSLRYLAILEGTSVVVMAVEVLLYKGARSNLIPKSILDLMLTL